MARESIEFSKAALREGVKEFFGGDEEQAAWYGVKRKMALAKDDKKNKAIEANQKEGKALPKWFEPKTEYEPLYEGKKYTIPKEAKPKAEPKPRKPKAEPKPKAAKPPKAKPAPKPKATGTAAKLAKPKAEPKPKAKEPEVKGEAKPPVAVADTGKADLPVTPVKTVSDDDLVAYVKANPDTKASTLIGKFQVSFNRAKAAVDKAKAAAPVAKAE